MLNLNLDIFKYDLTRGMHFYRMFIDQDNVMRSYTGWYISQSY